MSATIPTGCWAANRIIPLIIVPGAGDEPPKAVHKLGNYPNPFNPATTITFSLPAPSTTSLGVYDISGRIVKTLLKEELLGQGTHEKVWNGVDEQGRLMPSGTYVYRLEAGEFSQTKRMTLLKVVTL